MSRVLELYRKHALNWCHFLRWIDEHLRSIYESPARCCLERGAYETITLYVWPQGYRVDSELWPLVMTLNLEQGHWNLMILFTCSFIYAYV